MSNNNNNKNHTHKIHIAALNVLTLKNKENFTELMYALKHIKWDIVGLSEVRRIGENMIYFPDYLFFHKGETLGLLLKIDRPSNLQTINTFYR